MSKQDKKEPKFNRGQKVGIVLVILVIISMAYSNFKHGKLTPDKTITFEQIDYEPVTTEMNDFNDYDYSYTDYYDEDEDEEYHEDWEGTDEVVEEVTTEEVTTEEPEYSDRPEINTENDYSKPSNGYWDSINATVEDIPIVDDSNFDYIMSGLIMGYVSDCIFVTNSFIEMHSKAFLPDVESVEILSKNLEAYTSTVRVNGSVDYTVNFTMIDGAIDTVDLYPMEGED